LPSRRAGWAVRAHDRDCASASEDRAGQSGVQHEAAGLAGENRPRLSAGSDLRPQDPEHRTRRRIPDEAPSKISSTSLLKPVNRGVQLAWTPSRKLAS
jgi:hypothetical protein